jgi:phosphoribosylformylglycinamidine cyclo-ligase
LTRKVIFERLGLGVQDKLPGSDLTVGEALLVPTRIYVRAVRELLGALGNDVHGLSHITGGGLPGNLPRVLPDGLGAKLDLSAFERPTIFRVIAEGGPVEEHEMRRTYNLGVGLIVITSPDSAALEVLGAAGENAFRLGEVIEVGADVEFEDRVQFER